MKKLVVCGDSFNYGIGCINLHTQPYAVLTAKKLGWDCIRLARGSSSNYAIYLQGSYASKMDPKPDLIILGTTSNDRIEWVKEGEELNEDPSLEHLNYHQYPPHNLPQSHHDAPMPFHLQEDKNYKPKILSEQVTIFDNFFKEFKKGTNNEYYKRLREEPREKLELINRYYFEVWNSQIKRDYDVGVIMLAYRKIKKAGINCIILTPDYKFYDLVDHEMDFFPVNWSHLYQMYPDKIGSMHVSEDAHELISNELVEHIKKYNLN